MGGHRQGGSATPLTRRVLALRERCSHQDCPVRFVAASERFICPCDGAIFDARGKPVAGPAAGPLERWQVRVADGRVEVRAPG